MPQPKAIPSIQEFAAGIQSGDMRLLSQAITLVESSKPEHQLLADQLLEAIPAPSKPSIRIGITGIPGVGKSTLIESLGQHVIQQGHSLAVLAVDPSSSKTSGSILGDKTRMTALSMADNAFIRPSPAGTSLGGVTRKTREAILLCEAAGFDTLFVETVGVGQSETAVHTMVDFFLLLLLARSGDELQGIKRGIMELADTIFINKADGDNVVASKRARSEFKAALHLFPAREDKWTPKVELCSGLSGDGIPQMWQVIQEFATLTQENGSFYQQRTNQNASWFDQDVRQLAYDHLTQGSDAKKHLESLREQVQNGELSAFRASRQFYGQLLSK